MKVFFLKMPSVKSANGRPTFIFERDGKTIIAVADNLQSSKVYASGKRIPDEYLVEFEATQQQLEKLELTPTPFEH